MLPLSSSHCRPLRTSAADCLAMRSGWIVWVSITIPANLQAAVPGVPVLPSLLPEPRPTRCSHFSGFLLRLPDALLPSDVRYRPQGCLGMQLNGPSRRGEKRMWVLGWRLLRKVQGHRPEVQNAGHGLLLSAPLLSCFAALNSAC